MLLISLNVRGDNLNLFFSGLELSLRLFLDVGLLADLGVDVSLELSNFFDLGAKFLLFLEAFNLLIDDLNFRLLFFDIFLLRVDDNLRDGDLLFNMLFKEFSLLEFLAGVSQFSSSSGLLSDGFLSLGHKSLNLLSVIDDLSGNAINRLLDLGLLSYGNNFNLLLKVLLLLNKRGSGRSY